VVPLVHLVFQQGNVIEANTVAHTKRMCSEVYGHPKTWEQWQRLFDTEDVLIMTGQIFLSALSHSLITIGQVCLIIASLISDQFAHFRRMSSCETK
jgi:endoribonuclease Dicer